MNTSDIVLSVENLATHFPVRTGTVRAVDGISFDLKRGKTLCVVGESGSGKSVAARSILQIVDAPGRIVSGSIKLTRPNGSITDLASLGNRSRAIREVRGAEIAMIFQEPMSSLSPVHTIGDQIIEVLRLHLRMSKQVARARAIELLAQVEIPKPEIAIDRYTFEYSGGMRQRAMIAMALACEPSILIADEPTTALDVTTQAEILDLIRRLQQKTGMSVLFITHDMGVVAEIADDVLVMYKGKVMETGPVDQIFHAPQNDYTRMLIGSVVKLQQKAESRQRATIQATASGQPAAGTGQPTLAASPQLPAAVLSEQRSATATNIIEVRDLSMHFTSGKNVNKAVDQVSFDVKRGETLGIVGESGSGKTTMGRSLLRVYDVTAGSMLYRRADGSSIDLAAANKATLQACRREIRMIFQDPFGSLNPRMTVSQIIAEPLLVNNIATGAELEDRVADLMQQVGLEPAWRERYPHAFSGGQRQRIGIARAIALDPRVIVADEATSALDVSLRAQMLDLLMKLQDERGLSFVFISHDLGVIRYMCDRVAVMYRGKIVEMGDTDDVCDRPQHRYTQALLSAIPEPDPRKRRIHQRVRYTADAAA